jgi:hypothetical protein
MRWMKKLFGGGTASVPTDPSVASATAPNSRIQDDDPRIGAGHALIDAYWAGIGTCDKDLLTYLINPQFQGAPPWPNMRQAFRIVRTADALIVASDGMSDPWVGTDITDESGFGMEVFIELPGLQDTSQDAIMAGPIFSLVEMAARNIADLSGITSRLDRFGVLSMEVPHEPGFGAGWTSDEGMSAALFGVPVHGRETHVVMPFGAVRMVPMTLLHQQELNRITSGGAEARVALAAALVAAGIGHRSDPRRAPVM